MGLDTGVCLARTLRLSRVGHHPWLLLPPSTGYAACATGQPVALCAACSPTSALLTGPSAASSFMSPTLASYEGCSGLSGAMGFPSGLACRGVQRVGQAGAGSAAQTGHRPQ